MWWLFPFELPAGPRREVEYKSWLIVKLYHMSSTGDEDELAQVCCDEEREDWIAYLRKELRACPAYAAHSALLEECVGIASCWRERFQERKALWTRIRRGSRLSKELAEQVQRI